MSEIEPALHEALTALVTALARLKRDFCIIGALVPQLLLSARPQTMTLDADALVVVKSMDAFKTLKGKLRVFGFEGTSAPHRLRYRNGTLVDLIPYSQAMAPKGELVLEDQTVLNVAGFDQAINSAIPVELTPRVFAPVAPIPLYVLLKLIAYSDRKLPKDLTSVLYCARHYADDERDDRPYGLEHEGSLVPYQVAGAYLLGQDGRKHHEERLRSAVVAVLDRFDSQDAPIIDQVGREEGRVMLEDSDRKEILDLVEWFRRGAGL
ncbi:MAG: hypothetical protein HY652_14305 [Acidobacteria bacterium]|nr:hypothetical protein [Acidobacteriota bacterium]